MRERDQAHHIGDDDRSIGFFELAPEVLEGEPRPPLHIVVPQPLLPQGGGGAEVGLVEQVRVEVGDF